MAKPIKKIRDKLVKINDSLTVNLYDNGYMVEVNGRNANDDWTQVKLSCNSLEEINTLIKEANEIDKV